MSAAKSYRFVCLGGGNASGYLARELVALGLKPGELAIITEEPHVAYERPALSKAYLFPTGAARLPGFHTCVGGGGERQEAGWYADRGISYLTGCRVTAADVAGRTLTLGTGEVLRWTDALVVATGAEPVRLSDFGAPGAGLPGIHYLRNVEDADALLQGVAAAKAARNKAVVVGGGYIGLEVAAALSLNGLDVTMVFPEQRLMARLLSPELAGFYEAYYQARGVRLARGLLAKAFGAGDGGRVASVSLSDGGELPADLVVVGAGARPASGLFKGQLELDAAGGILVDGNLKASAEGVLAIGDVSSFPATPGGAPSRQEHVTHARSSAAHAARVLMGADPSPYTYTPFFYSRVFNLSWQFFGRAEGAELEVTWGALGAEAARAAAAPGGAAPKFGAYYLQGGRVVGAFIEGPSAEESAALKALAAAPPPAPDPQVLRQQGIAWALSCKL